MLGRREKARRITLGADKAYDVNVRSSLASSNSGTSPARRRYSFSAAGLTTTDRSWFPVMARHEAPEDAN